MANPIPTIVFEVDLTIPSSQTMGPSTNQTTFNMQHVDRFQESQDNAVEQIDARKNTISTFLPSLTLGNHVLKHGDIFTEYGQKAVYLRNNYAVGYAAPEVAYLKIVSVS